jgi:PP-loop superfamily ATP-utilizing enzyme
MFDFNNITKETPVVCWFSGGATSAVACKIAIDLFGKENCKAIFIDTRNEDYDTYRFLKDCEEWYGIEIEEILNPKWKNIQEVWRTTKSLNVATGAICSSELKREARTAWQKNNKFSLQIFGFDISEIKRARAFSTNYGTLNPVYPLLFLGYSKEKCIELIQKAGITVPRIYSFGFNNNNCFKTGCVQGGIGYWQKMQKDFPNKFNRMARMEHELTALKGSPVTMLKDQSNAAKKSGNQLIFLTPHPKYPEMKDISMMQGRPPKPLLDCNGFCGVNDLERNPTEKEINFIG